MRIMRWCTALTLAFLITGCGYPLPREVRPGVYQLNFCEEEIQCFEAAKKTCPNGFRVTKYESSRPLLIVCQ